MSLDKTWIGLTVGADLSIIGGGSANLIKFVNMGCPNVTMTCGVKGVRLGAVAHVGAGASIAIMTGVRTRADVKGLKSSGVDFAIDVGGKIGALLKDGSLAARGVKALAKVDDINKLKVWAGSEAAKGFVNALTGDLNLSSSRPSFAIFSTPAGVGLGAGIWYEWHSVQGISGANGWDYMPPAWRVVSHAGQLWLQVLGLPVDDGTRLIIRFREKKWGFDNTLKVSEPFMGDSFPVVSGVVRDHCLCEPAGNNTMNLVPPSGGGINLSWRRLVGRWANGGMEQLQPNERFGLGIAINHNSRIVWEADDYASVQAGANGGFGKVIPERNLLH